MPIYEYECRKCGHRFEERRGVDDRHNVSCQRCGSKTIGIVIGPVSVHTDLEPYYDVQLGCHIKSKQHKRSVAKDMGLTDVGNASVYDVEKEAEKNRKHREEKWLNERPSREFMEAWEKAKATYPSDN